MSSRIACPTRTLIAGDTVCASRYHAKRSNAGFTLIEVVVALALVAIIITAIGAVVTLAWLVLLLVSFSTTPTLG